MTRLRLTEVIDTLRPCREGRACLRRALRGSPSLEETVRRHLAERHVDAWWIAASLRGRVRGAHDAFISPLTIADFDAWVRTIATPQHVIAWLDEYAGQLIAERSR